MPKKLSESAARAKSQLTNDEARKIIKNLPHDEPVLLLRSVRDGKLYYISGRALEEMHHIGGARKPDEPIQFGPEIPVRLAEEQTLTKQKTIKEGQNKQNEATPKADQTARLFWPLTLLFLNKVKKG
jgi:hypothetical protein